MATPEEQARQHIDAQLGAAEWHVASAGSTIGTQPTALCEAIGHSSTHSGRADYIIYLDGKACGILEAKRPDRSLVADKNKALVEYATANMDQNLFVRKYLLQLPSKEELTSFIQDELETL